MLHLFLTVVQFICTPAIVALILIQRGKGAEAGAGFGAGASGTVFGARGASTALSRATAILAAVFMANSLALAYMGTRQTEQPKTILDTAGETAPAPTGSAPALTLPAAVSAAMARSSAPAGGAVQSAPAGVVPGAPAGAAQGAPAGATPTSAPGAPAKP
jgi:preprotein translocase subunit SecG